MALSRDSCKILGIDLASPDERFQCVGEVIDKVTKVRRRCALFINKIDHKEALDLIRKMNQTTNYQRTTDLLAKLANFILCSRHRSDSGQFQLVLRTWTLLMENETLKLQKETSTLLIVNRELSQLVDESEIESQAGTHLSEIKSSSYVSTLATSDKQASKEDTNVANPVLGTEALLSMTVTESNKVLEATLERETRPRSPLKQKSSSTHNAMSANKATASKGIRLSQTIIVANSVNVPQKDVVDSIPKRLTTKIRETTKDVTQDFTVPLRQSPTYLQVVDTPALAESLPQQPSIPPGDITSSNDVRPVASKKPLVTRQDNIPIIPPGILDDSSQSLVVSAPPESVDDDPLRSSNLSFPPPAIQRKPVAAQAGQVVGKAPEVLRWEENRDRAQEQPRNKPRRFGRIRDNIEKAKRRLSNVTGLEYVSGRREE